MLSPLFFKVMNNVSVKMVLFFVLVQFFVVEGLQKNIPDILAGTLYFKLYDHLYYLFGARMLCYVGGMLLAKYSVLTHLKTRLGRYSVGMTNILLIVSILLCSIVLCVLSKGILLIFFALIVFVIFNLYHKSKLTKAVFAWLGKQSLYIWLLHPFICYTTFPVLRIWLLSFKYSVVIFIVLLVTCAIVSIILNRISDRIIHQIVKI